MVIVDSSVMIDFLADKKTPQTTWIDRHLGVEQLGITNLILCEVLQGVRSDSRFEEMLESLKKFEIFDNGSAALAVASARNYRRLRELGITIRNTIDCMIATFCILEGHRLLHRDSDFAYFETYLQLQVLHTKQAVPN